MRVAFVGKGGSGKSTVTALFSRYIDQATDKNQWLVDADLNINLGKLVDIDELSQEHHLSSINSRNIIKKYLIGNNNLIKSPDHLKKTTPPTAKSGFFNFSNKSNLLFTNFSINKNNTYLSVVGTYQGSGIGTSCYHNNLSILENILSHSIDLDSYIVVDMVAGIDAFAGSLHSQFDVLVFVVEPTIKSVDVFGQYLRLATEAKVDQRVYVVGNKIRGTDDRDFILENVPKNKIIGFLPDSDHIRRVDKGAEKLSFKKLEDDSKSVFNEIEIILETKKVPPRQRLEHLYDLHRKYVAQSYVKDRFGDLTEQIDESFDIENYIKQYEI